MSKDCRPRRKSSWSSTARRPPRSGVTFEEINNTISTNLGSAYINDFPNRGRMQRVIVQADRNARMQADQILTYNVRNSQRSARADVVLRDGAVGRSARRRSSASTIILRSASRARPSPAIPAAMRSARWSGSRRSLPRGFGYEWAGQSLQEKLSGSQAPFLLMLSVLLVFLVLAALYESWTIPLAVLLTVPLGILGAVAAAMLRGLPNDVYFTVGIVTIIGLAAKDGILIIEFAKALREQGKPIRDATIEACRMRFRPIVMTGLAFVFGVAPMIDRRGRQRQEPAGARHRRDGRDDRGGDPRAADGADLLRRGAGGVRQGGPAGAEGRVAIEASGGAADEGGGEAGAGRGLNGLRNSSTAVIPGRAAGANPKSRAKERPVPVSLDSGLARYARAPE